MVALMGNQIRRYLSRPLDAAVFDLSSVEEKANAVVADWLWLAAEEVFVQTLLGETEEQRWCLWKWFASDIQSTGNNIRVDKDSHLHLLPIQNRSFFHTPVPSWRTVLVFPTYIKCM